MELRRKIAVVTLTAATLGTALLVSAPAQAGIIIPQDPQAGVIIPQDPQAGVIVPQLHRDTIILEDGVYPPGPTVVGTGVIIHDVTGDSIIMDS